MSKGVIPATRSLDSDGSTRICAAIFSRRRALILGARPVDVTNSIAGLGKTGMAAFGRFC
jgi:hypothetical protein